MCTYTTMSGNVVLNVCQQTFYFGIWFSFVCFDMDVNYRLVIVIVKPSVCEITGTVVIQWKMNTSCQYFKLQFDILVSFTVGNDYMRKFG